VKQNREARGGMELVGAAAGEFIPTSNAAQGTSEKREGEQKKEAKGELGDY